MQHLTGNILTEVVFGQILRSIEPWVFTNVIWPSAFVVYPIERTLLVVLSVVVGVPLIKTLKKSVLPFKPETADAQKQVFA
jgi:hypothetical protein